MYTLEQWKAIPNFEGRYEASTQGRIRGLDRLIVCKNGAIKPYKGRVLTPYINSAGYFSIRLGKAYPTMVHTLVALTFIGERPENYQICHYDNNKLNNAPSNLRYATPTENQGDRKRHGTALSGEGVKHLVKLTDLKVLDIRANHAEGRLALAKRHGVCTGTIGNILNGRSWKHLLGG